MRASMETKLATPRTHRFCHHRAKAARLLAGVAMDEARRRLVDRLGTHAPCESTLYRWERGLGAPSALLWPHLAAVYECNANDLCEEVA